MTRQIPDGVLLTYECVGHGVVFRGPCPRTAIDNYLIDGVLPAPGTHCPALPPA